MSQYYEGIGRRKEASARVRIFVRDAGPVSYTHLDVYKRQGQRHPRDIHSGYYPGSA